MEDLKAVVAANLINLRTGAGLTQAQLAEKLNYSDKSVSKWERAEALPDANVLKMLGEIFGVTVDSILTPVDAWKQKHPNRGRLRDAGALDYHSNAVIAITVVGIWTLALLVFIILWLVGFIVWVPFICAVPLSLVALMVMYAVWHGDRKIYYIIAAIVASMILTLYLIFLRHNWWQLFLLLVPAEIIVFLASRIRKQNRKP